MVSIDHVVVLMLENRSFDHMLGYLYDASNAFEGVKGREANYFNLADPLNSSSTRYNVNPSARSKDLNKDSGHDFVDVHRQVFGVPLGQVGVPTPPQNGGFVVNYEGLNPGAGPRIMNCFNPSTLPVLSRLGEEFAVCDHWFSSMPGPTWPNRVFVHTGSSDGEVDNKYRRYNNETVFNQLQSAGKTWSFYMDGHVTQAMALTRLWSWKKWAFRRLDTFKSLAASGKLPNYSFLEPRFFRFLLTPPTDQHPPHVVQRGEELIADVYKAVRNGPDWERTLLIITYDEHGGTYDHVYPLDAVPPGPISQNPHFDFDRYGVRVPAVVVSPYVDRNTVLNTIFDHTSIIATVRHVFGVPGFLTPRDAAAAPVDTYLNRNFPRSDTPTDIRDSIAAEHKVAALRAMSETEVPPGEPTGPLSSYQEQLLSMSRDLAQQAPRPLGEVARDFNLPAQLTEDVAAREVETNVRAFLQS